MKDRALKYILNMTPDKQQANCPTVLSLKASWQPSVCELVIFKDIKKFLKITESFLQKECSFYC